MVSATTVETTVKGKWVTVPALPVGDKFVIARGSWLRQACILDEQWLETELEDPDACIKQLKQGGRRILHTHVFTFAQKLPNVTPKFSYTMEWDSIAAIRTSNFKQWWESLPQETRKNARRAQKRGVTVEVKSLDDAVILGITGVNNDSDIRQNIRNVHFGKTPEQTWKDQVSFSERSDFICAYHEGEMIGFMKIVYRGEIASILQLLPKASQQDKRPANALITKAVEVCESKGISYLTYGMFNYGNKKHSSLREFKERNGFQEILVPRYYVPLSLWGAVCIKAKLHRGLIGILPSRLIATFVRLRAVCYNFFNFKAGVAQR
jgi:hypothetical protein